MGFSIDTFELRRTDKRDAGRAVFYGGGLGRRNAEFRAWAAGTSHYRVCSDWPCEYFAFADPADEAAFEQKYSAHLRAAP
jgi:hypothetical protein